MERVGGLEPAALLSRSDPTRMTMSAGLGACGLAGFHELIGPAVARAEGEDDRLPRLVDVMYQPAADTGDERSFD